MAKAKVRTVVVPCVCSTCGQAASVEAGKPHNFCRGFKIVKPLPGLFRDLKNPNKQGVWTPVSAPIQQG